LVHSRVASVTLIQGLKDICEEVCPQNTYGELPEGSWLMCDAVKATEYNDCRVLIRLHGDPP